MFWKILILIVLTIIFGTVVLTATAFVLELLATLLRTVAKAIDWFGLDGILKIKEIL